VASTDPTGGAGKWTVANVDGTHVLRGVSCPSTSLCVAVDDTGNVLTSTDPTDGTSWTPSNVDASNVLFAVSCASSSLCVAVDVPGHVVTTTNPTGGPAAWTVTTVAGAARFYGVSCPSSSLCVAVDSGGNVATGTARPPSESIQEADGDPFVASSTPAGPAAGVSPTARQAVTGVLIDRRWRLGSLPASYSRLAPSGTT